MKKDKELKEEKENKKYLKEEKKKQKANLKKNKPKLTADQRRKKLIGSTIAIILLLAMTVPSLIAIIEAFR